MLKTFTFSSIVFLASTVSAFQQTQSAPANFKAIIVDAYVARIPNASVVIEGTGPDRKWNLHTDAEGQTIGEINLKLPPGKYNFTIDAPGFKRLVVADICIIAKTKVTYEFQMVVRDCDDCYPIKPPSALPNKSLDRSHGKREFIADFQLPIVDLFRAARSTQPLGRTTL